MPKKWNNPPMIPSDIVMGSPGQANYCHGGCSLCQGKSQGDKEGVLTCAYL
jgi:hypothetical protein